MEPHSGATVLKSDLETDIILIQNCFSCRYLTPATAIMRLLTAPMRIGRYFDAEVCAASHGAMLCGHCCSALASITSVQFQHLVNNNFIKLGL